MDCHACGLAMAPTEKRLVGYGINSLHCSLLILGGKNPFQIIYLRYTTFLDTTLQEAQIKLTAGVTYGY